MEQKKFKLDKVSLLKTLKGAGIAGGAVALVYILTWITTLDLGSYTAISVGVASILINFLREYYKGV